MYTLITYMNGKKTWSDDYEELSDAIYQANNALHFWTDAKCEEFEITTEYRGRTEVLIHGCTEDALERVYEGTYANY